jgi:hypothetical protein
MTINLPERDPEAAYARRASVRRRIGPNAKCACGEARPEALIREKKRVICPKCKRKENGMTTTDDHHFAMKANSPITLPVPVNDHRAELNVAQQDWPKQTRENPDGSPFLAAAGCIRGFIDTILYLVKQGLLWVADMLEKADAFLTQKFGTKWWIGTEIEKFVPKQ